LVAAREDSANWLTYSGAYDGRRYSRLSEIDRTTASRLRLKWAHPLATSHPVETTPLVVDGTLYLTRPPNEIVALDAENGRELWRFSWPVPDGLTFCCGLVNRGVAVLGQTLYLGTLDAHLVAVDARTGRLRWRTRVGEWAEGFHITSAPLAVRDLIVVGVALNQEKLRLRRRGEAPVLRGRIDAYDAATGELRWRFHTIPVAGELGSDSWADASWTVGGGATWMTGSFDPALNLVYWGVGAPNAYQYGELRPGDNLYCNAVVALDAGSGRLVWHFQFTPHDVRDWDASQVLVLADLDVAGRTRKALLTANRNGFYYALDRETGEFLVARAFAAQTWAAGIDPRGRPIRAGVFKPTERGVQISPTVDGAASWWSPSFSLRSGLFYVTAHDATERVYLGAPPPAGLAAPTWPIPERMIERTVDHERLVSAVRALDAATGIVRWEFPLPLRSTGGILTTAGDVLFTGSTLGDVWALDALNGEVLWHERVEGWFHAAPITYMAGGRQQVTIASSAAVYTFVLDP
jgi:alcohol dehydrogenase (cytochrome c)